MKFMGFFTLALTALVAGCNKPAAPSDAVWEAAKKENDIHPVGRYQYVKSYRVYEGTPRVGTEHMCFDTAKSELMFAYIPDNPELLIENSFICK